MKLIDSNVIIYAHGVPHPYRESCRQLLEDVETGKFAACLSTEVVQEVMNIYHRRGHTREAAAIARDLLVLFPVVFDVTTMTIRLAIDILTANSHLQSRDAVHAATVVQQRLEGLVSTDKGFDSVVGLKRFDPKELAA